MTTEQSVREREFTGHHMWLLTLAFFGVIIGVNVFMAVMSSRSWTGLAVENSYVASQEFERKRLAHASQLAAGWSPSFTYVPGASVLAITDASGKPMDIGSVTLTISRPVGGHDDQVLVLQPGADGRYLAGVTLAAGVWDAVAETPDTPLGPFELRERFRVETSK